MTIFLKLHKISRRPKLSEGCGRLFVENFKFHKICSVNLWEFFLGLVLLISSQRQWFKAKTKFDVNKTITNLQCDIVLLWLKWLKSIYHFQSPVSWLAREWQLLDSVIIMMFLVIILELTSPSKSSPDYYQLSTVFLCFKFG